MNLNWPLMDNNITSGDISSVIEFLKTEPILTQSKKVKQFEAEWSKWLGVKYSIFVNSGSSANLLSMLAVRHKIGEGEVLVPGLCWSSNIASIIHAGLKPVFVDINLNNLAMLEEDLMAKTNANTKAVFLCHIQGFNGLSQKILDFCSEKKLCLIEDACESHGASFQGKKVGSFGAISNFSFYYAHHMTTTEGGMVCTDDEELYQFFRMCRSHGMLRESTNDSLKEEYYQKYPELNPEFIFTYPGFNVRNTEISAVMGLNQLPRLNDNNQKRNENFALFLKELDSSLYFTDFDMDGSSNYAFNLVLKDFNLDFAETVMRSLREWGVEYRRGSAGGGNQARQPMVSGFITEQEYKSLRNTEHMHFCAFYIGNYPDLEKSKILELCKRLNSLKNN